MYFRKPLFKIVIRVALLLSFLAGVVGPAGAQPSAQTSRLQPLLAQMAAENPEQILSVIVQKSGAGSQPEQLAEQLGGTLTRDLRIINAFSAELPASALVQLSAHPAVKWVSLDALMTGSAVVDEYIADNFEIRQYNNQDGSLPWTSDWIEMYDDGQADSGDVKIDQEKLRIEKPNKGLRRSLDLSQASSPILSLNYRRESMGTSQAFVNLEVSSNGGNSWVLLGTFGGPVNEGDLQPAESFDLTPYASAQTSIRFTTSAGMTGKLWVDNLKISFSQETTRPVFTTWATGFGKASAMEFSDAVKMVDENSLGPDGMHGYGASVKGSFAGFEPTVIDGYKIARVEAVLHAYIEKPSLEETKLKVYVAGSKQGEVALRHVFDGVVGSQNAGLVYINLTGLSAWKYADFYNGLELLIEQRQKSDQVVHYDAVGLRVALEPGVDLSIYDLAAGTVLPKAAIDVSHLQMTAPLTVRAAQVWNESPSFLQGKDMTVAIVDSGVLKNKDLGGRKLKDVNFNHEFHDAKDEYGHGTLVANLVAGDGRKSDGVYMGIAPQSNIVNVRISDQLGMSSEAEVVEGLGWILENKARYNIRVVNLSLNSSVAQDYHTSPLDAAVEVLWFNGIVVVVSAGNSGAGTIYPPANDPFVITVGAIDERMTASVADDLVANFSVYGTTEGGFAKPDLVAPGKDLIAHLPKSQNSSMGRGHPERRIGSEYLRVSGTSFAAPIVSAAVALLLQDEPGLTPDQVKYRLMATANQDWAAFNPVIAGAGILDAYAAVKGTTTQSANSGIAASQLLWTGDEPVLWGSVAWNSVSWGSVAWGSVAWNSVAWNSVAWGSDFWGDCCTIALPQGPTSLVATPVSANQVDLTWSGTTGEIAGYLVERSETGAEGPWAAIYVDNPAASGYSDQGLLPDTQYWYRVSAFNTTGFSQPSSTQMATTGSSVVAPSGLSGAATSDTTLSLTWTDNSGNEDGFRVERSQDDGFTWMQVGQTLANVATFEDTGLNPDATYTYRVFAYNAGGLSASSNQFSITLSAPSEPEPTPTPTEPAPTPTPTEPAPTPTPTEPAPTPTPTEPAPTPTPTEPAPTPTPTEPAPTPTPTEPAPTPTPTPTEPAPTPTPTEPAPTPTPTPEAPNLEPPQAPSGLGGEAISPSRVSLAWTDNSDNEGGFRVERSSDNGLTWEFAGQTEIDAVTFEDSSLSEATTYTYRVFAFNAIGNSLPSNEIQVSTPLAPPVRPVGLVATALSATRVRLTWRDRSTNELGFRIQRSIDGGATWTTIGKVGADQTIFKDKTVRGETTYMYQVFAYSAAGKSAFSNQVTITTPPGAPLAPTGLTIVNRTQNSLTLRWKDNATNETGYYLEYSLNGKTWTRAVTLPANTVAIVHSGLKADTRYYYRVRAFNSYGTSVFSNTVAKRTIS